MGQSVLTASLSDQVTAAPLRNKKKAHRQNTMTAPPPPPSKEPATTTKIFLIKYPLRFRAMVDHPTETGRRGCLARHRASTNL